MRGTLFNGKSMECTWRGLLDVVTVNANNIQYCSLVRTLSIMMQFRSPVERFLSEETYGDVQITLSLI